MTLSGTSGLGKQSAESSDADKSDSGPSADESDWNSESDAVAEGIVTKRLGRPDEPLSIAETIASVSKLENENEDSWTNE